MKLLIPALTVLLMGAAPAAAERVSVLVFDASGSMWNRLDGDLTRIEVARDVMGDYFASRDGTSPLSVIAYGHNRRGDCSDIEVVAPMGNTVPSDLETRLRALMPKGMTPLTDSLSMARDQIPDTAEAADIILVTDGLETCEGDPCALAARLAGEGIDIRAHVVGFGLTKAEVEALSCITEQTGGMLFETNSGNELAEALRQVSAAEPAPQPVPEPVAVQEAAFDIGDKAEAGFTYRIGWKGDATFVDYMGFVPTGAARGNVSGSYSVIGGTSDKPNNPASRVAPVVPGTYDLILLSATNGVIARQTVEVVASTMGFEAIGSVEPGSRVVFYFRGPEQIEERIVIARPEDPPATYMDSWSYALSKKGKTRLRAPNEPGEYEVRYLNSGRSEILFSRRFGVGIPFEDADTTTSDDLAALAAAATRGDASQDVLPDVSATFRLPSGPYEVATWRAEPLEPGMPPARQLEGSSPVITASLPAGRWKVIAESSGDAVLSAEVEIFPGAPTDVTLELETAQLDGALSGEWTLYALPPPEITDPPMAMARFDLRLSTEGMDYVGSFTTTQAMGGVQSGQLQSVIVDQDDLLEILMVLPSVGPAPLRIALLPDGDGYSGQMFVPNAVMPMAMTRGAPPVMKSEAAAQPETVARCDQPEGCAVTQGRLSVILPGGWSMTRPDFSGVVGDAAPSDLPRVQFFGTAAKEELRLNPRQWLESNGPCVDTLAGPLCYFKDAPASVTTPALIIGGTLKVAKDDATLAPVPQKCEQDLCRVKHIEAGFAVELPRGWQLDHARSEGGQIFASFSNADNSIVLTGRGSWSPENGPCHDSTLGLVCYWAGTGNAVRLVAPFIAQSLVSLPQGQAPVDGSVAGPVSVAPAINEDLVAGSGGFFPITIDAPAGLTGRLSLHGPDGVSVVDTDLAHMLTAQDQVLPIPERAGMYEIRVVDASGSLRATTGIQIVGADPVAASGTSGTLEIIPAGRTQFGNGCFIDATLSDPKGADYQLFAPVTATSDGRALRSIVDADAPLIFELFVAGGMGQTVGSLMLMAPCAEITLELGAVQCRYNEGDDVVMRDCALPVSLAPLGVIDEGSHLTDAILDGVTSTDDGAITTQPRPPSTPKKGVRPTVTTTKSPAPPVADDLQAYRPMTPEEIDAAFFALQEKSQ